MQNQRQKGRPDAAVRMAGLFLVLFCVAAVLIPAKTLFTGNGFFADSCGISANGGVGGVSD